MFISVYLPALAQIPWCNKTRCDSDKVQLSWDRNRRCTFSMRLSSFCCSSNLLLFDYCLTFYTLSLMNGPVGGETDSQLFLLLLQWRTQPQEEQQYVDVRRLAVYYLITAVMRCPDSIDSCAARLVLDEFSWQAVWNMDKMDKIRILFNSVLMCRLFSGREELSGTNIDLWLEG